MTNEDLLQQAKDQVAEFAGWSDWNAFESAYRAAIKNYNESPGIKKYISDYRTLSDRAAMIAIQNAREEAAPKWIPVSESLPVIEEGYNSYTVLIYTNETYTWTGYYNHWKECWFSDIDEKVIVTHWMPLPDHPVVEFPFLKN